MPKIIFDKVTYQFNTGIKAINDFSLEINQGEFVFLVGHSGAGKTTFMRLLIREILPTEGKIFLDDKEISKKRGVSTDELRRTVRVAFQDVKLLNDRTVEENIAMALEILGKKDKEIKKAVEEVLELVGLTDKKEMFPVQLSGGETQRIGLARAIVSGPDILFADEPTANLDNESAWKITSVLKEVNRSGKTVIVATHNRDLFDSMGERVILMEKGEIKKDEPAGRKKEK